jgi:hypothetical protein
MGNNIVAVAVDKHSTRPATMMACNIGDQEDLKHSIEVVSKM